MMLGAHPISSGRKFQGEADAVSNNRFPNVFFLRFGTSDVILLISGDDWGGTSLISHIHKYSAPQSACS